MPDKTARILGYLSRLFQAGPRRSSPLYHVVDAFGSQLQQAENYLAAIMRSHWVGHADKGESEIDDLAKIAALYGLAPREDETIEEFREHLLRYVHTFLDGTVTVQGALRVVAEALGLHIEDDYADVDTWWTRADPDLVTVEPIGKDATEVVFGFRSKEAKGVPARAASVRSPRPHLGGIDLGSASRLSLIVDDGNPLELDLRDALEAGFPTMQGIPLANIVAAINGLAHLDLARDEDGTLVLTSPTIGASSRLELLDVEQDAALPLLSVLPRRYVRGGVARPAEVSSVDLSAGVLLGGKRFLRIVVDGTHLAEVDLDGVTTAEMMRDRINAAFALLLGGQPLASVENHRVKLTSPSSGNLSTIAFQRPAAQDATALLFGAVRPVYLGEPDLPAMVIGTRDHNSGALDLSDNDVLQLRLNDGPSITVHCAGANPAETLTQEVVAAINNAVGAPVARFDGKYFRLTSAISSPESSIVLETPPSDDASSEIFGIGPRVFAGKAARASRIQGKVLVRLEQPEGEDEPLPPLPPVDLAARYRVAVIVDGGTPAEIDLRSLIAQASVDDIRNMPPGKMAAAVNEALGKHIASSDGERLTLLSETVGGASQLALRPLEQRRRRRYVSRAAITDEATGSVFGFNRREAHGSEASRAQIVGKRDLSRGVDLSAARFLRIQIDDATPVDVDCAGPRPRATITAEARQQINAQLRAKLGIGRDLVSDDGRQLTITSPQTGAHSKIVLSGSPAMDALDVVLGLEAQTASGSNAEQVSFISTLDFSAGIDLPANATIRLAMDGGAAVDIALTEATPAHLSIEEAALKINLALAQNVARRAQNTLSLTSTKRGPDSQIAFELPTIGTDSTAALFGISAPREYRGAAASAGSLRGLREISGVVDVSITRYLRIAVDGQRSVDVDCAATALDAKSVTLDQIVAAINAGVKPKIASLVNNKLTLTSPTGGLTSEILMETPTRTPDATDVLFGLSMPQQQHGTGSQPAVLTAGKELRIPQDLSGARFIRLSIDGEAATEIDCAAGARDRRKVTPEEIVNAINAAVKPRPVASNVANRLVLTSPTVGANAQIKVQQYVADDTCRKLLFGDAPASSQGQAALPAIITGDADLKQPVDLSRRRVIRLQVDDGAPFDVRLGRLAPTQVLLGDIVEDINAAFPTLAAAVNDRLQLTSPTVGPTSKVAVLPLRYLEVIEYPPTQAYVPPEGQPSISVSHGERIPITNGGVGSSALEMWITAPQGATGPGLINTLAGWRVRALCNVNAGETLHMWQTESGQMRAEVIPTDGSPARPVPAAQLVSGPIGVQVRVPYFNQQQLIRLNEGYSALQLNNTFTDAIVVLRAREPLVGAIHVTVVEQATPVPPPLVLPVDGEPVALQGRVGAAVIDDQTVYHLLDGAGNPQAVLWAGPDVELGMYLNRAVVVRGPRFFDAQAIVVAQDIRALFDVTLIHRDEDGSAIGTEKFSGVTIGNGTDTESLTYQICTQSALVVAEEAAKATALALPPGRTEWMYTDCYGTRFNAAFFEDDARRYYFAGGHWAEMGLFNVSHFWYSAFAESLTPSAHYAPWAEGHIDPPVEIRFAWQMHEPGAFDINLPDDLPARFGGRFNEARFGHAPDKPELYAEAVLEPETDAKYLERLWSNNRAKSLVKIEIRTGAPPIGWTAVPMPFRTPQRLRGGSETEAARIYLSEASLEGKIIEITAKAIGDWANEITISARQAGPARYDVAIYYAGARFENARQVALGGKEGEDLATLTQKLIQPGPVGLLQGKAAGVRLRATRDRTNS